MLLCGVCFEAGYRLAAQENFMPSWIENSSGCTILKPDILPSLNPLMSVEWKDEHARSCHQDERDAYHPSLERWLTCCGRPQSEAIIFMTQIHQNWLEPILRSGSGQAHSTVKIPVRKKASTSTKVGFICSENCASALFSYLIFTPPMHHFLIYILF